MIDVLERIKGSPLMRYIFLCVAVAVAICFAFAAVFAFVGAIIISAWWLVAMLVCGIVAALFAGVAMYLED